MARGKRDGLLIAGGGLAGSLAALAMARARPEVPLLLVEEGERFGAGQIWSFFDEEVDEADRWLVEPLISQRWPGYYTAFPGQARKLKAGISCIRAEDLDRAVREALGPDRYRLGTKVVAVREGELVLGGGETIKADGAIDARGAANLSMLELGWRKFVGREYLFAEPHRVDRPVLIDATVEQLDGFRFVSCLPFSQDRMLVEDIAYSESPAVGEQIERYLALRGWKPHSALGEASGVLPVALGGDFDAFWRVGGARVAKIGLRGGLFNPVTGHALPDAVRTAGMLSRQPGFEGAALHDLFAAHAAQLWKKREFYRGFNATLFRSPPAERWHIFEQLYRLDPALIGRFQALENGLLDRRKIVGASARAA